MQGLPFLGVIDVAVIGGGPAGAACALALRTCTAHSVALIEASIYDNVRVGEHVSSALLPLLDYLEVKERFLAECAHVKSLAIRACWGRDVPVAHHSWLHWSGEGYLLDRGVFDAMLATAVYERGGSVYPGCRLEKVHASEDGPGWLLQIRHASGKRFLLRARFLVDAAGRQASVARRLGARSTRCDALIGVSRFGQMAGKGSSTGEILIESTQSGWWYSAPLPDQRLVMTFMTDASIWRAGSRPNADKWLTYLRDAPYTLARVEHSVKAISADVSVRPAHSHLLTEVAGEDWLAVGDASVSFDPLSSLGVGFALHAACSAAQMIEGYLADRDRQRLQTYTAAVKNQFAQYVPVWQAYYACEKRWPEAPFWLARISV
jgi:flavin-dependent dehydrogenase